MSQTRRIAVVACGVLEWNLRRAIDRLGHPADLTVLPGGLHANPAELRRRLQAELDRLDHVEGLDGIAVGYGLCGRGVVGLRAGRRPAALPRCEDCTAVFLGAQARYRAEFGRFPGTRYFTCGWFKGYGPERFGTARNRSLYDPSFRDLVERFGEENARFIVDFRESWRRNYQRAVYICFEGDPDYAANVERVRALAAAEGWRFEELEGDDALFTALVTGDWNRPGILVVKPGERVVSAPGAELIAAGQDLGQPLRQALARFRRGEAISPARLRAGSPALAPGADGGATRVRRGLGLGIDAGGTYTDSVLYDFATGQVLAWSKAPTTHHDLVIGIAESLRGLVKQTNAEWGMRNVESAEAASPSAVRNPQSPIAQVTRAALSTTLATNAIVEGKGQPVGLLLMGIDEDDLRHVTFRHKRLIPGRMSIEGLEQEPVDEAATRQAALDLAQEGAQAFAISGHAAVINPAHELAVARIVWEATQLPVVCGHTLTRDLNLFRRAATAGLNARLLPLIERLIRAVRQVLTEMGLAKVPLMVVCGDGAQLLDRYAERFPVQTLLSGPAASVVGALVLSGRREAVVADMGGTTLDVAVVKDGAAVLSRQGAEVGGFETCVRSMRIHTAGLGGDSELTLAHWPEVAVGPRRILPVSVAAQDHPTVAGLLRGLAERDLPSRGIEPAALVLRGQAPPPPHVDEHEAAILAALGPTPVTAVVLAARLGLPSPRFLRLRRLEEAGAVLRAGLTPTDLFHVEGRFNAFSTEAAAAAFDLTASVLKVGVDEIRSAVWRAIHVGIARQLIRAEFEEAGDWGAHDRTARFVIENLFRRDGQSGFNLHLSKPVVPIGAPVEAVFPALGEILGTEVLVPPFASVANAVGAIAGDVLLAEQVEIVAVSDGAFQVQSRLETVRSFGLDQALDAAESIIRRGLAEKARENDLPLAEPDFDVRESAVETPLGPFFLGLTLTGRLKA